MNMKNKANQIQIGKDYRINSNQIQYATIEKRIDDIRFLITGYNTQQMKNDSMIISVDQIKRKLRDWMEGRRNESEKQTDHSHSETRQGDYWNSFRWMFDHVAE